MGYRNLNSGNLRAQRRQQSRLSTQAPVGGSSVGHGSGLRFYDGGELIIDGLNTGMRFWIQETGGGNSLARLMFTFEDMTDVASEPAVWSQSTTKALILAGPLLNDSTAGEGYGGSNLFLNGKSAILTAGSDGVSPARLALHDDGGISLQGLNANFYLNDNGSLGLNDGHGRGFWINTDGTASMDAEHGYVRVNDSSASIQGSDAVYFGTGSGGAGYNSHSDGRLYLGSSGNNIQYDANGALSIRAIRDIQIIGSRRLDMWAPSGGQFNGDFTVAGSKNFIMDHPAKPGHTIKYAATESPVSGIEHRGRVTIGDDGTAEVVFPEHFTAIVKDGTDVDVFLQSYGPDSAWCDVPTKEGTTVHGEPGTVVAWHALAERTGADFTVVEVGSVQTQPEPQPETEGQQWQQQQPSPQK